MHSIYHINRDLQFGAVRASEEPPRAAFLAGVTRLWPDLFNSQNDNAGPEGCAGSHAHQ